MDGRKYGVLSCRPGFLLAEALVILFLVSLAGALTFPSIRSWQEEKELDLRGAHLSAHCYPIAIDLLARGLVTSEGIVTHRYALSEWESAIRVADSMDSVKVLLLPHAGEAR